MGPQELEDIRSLLVSLFEPIEGRFVLTKTQISIHKRSRRNVAGRFASLQLLEQPQCVVAPTGVGVRSDQYAGRSRTTLRKKDCLFQDRDCVCRLIVRDQRESQARERARIIWLYGQCAA
jgi:hypothetical protein